MRLGNKFGQSSRAGAVRYTFGLEAGDIHVRSAVHRVPKTVTVATVRTSLIFRGAASLRPKNAVHDRGAISSGKQRFARNGSSQYRGYTDGGCAAEM